jgi:rhodanese-related sulfurtransferase
MIMASKSIQPSEIGKDDEFIVIDVRESDELSEGNIENSIHLPLGSIIRNARQGKLDKYKDKKIVTYCNSGYRGNIAAEELSKVGFNVFNLDGGFQGWIKSRK